MLCPLLTKANCFINHFVKFSYIKQQSHVYIYVSDINFYTEEIYIYGFVLVYRVRISVVYNTHAHVQGVACTSTAPTHST